MRFGSTCDHFYRMKRYNIINNALGWVCFMVAAITYLLTLEPTASFWDCPEFILQGAKLEVGHPPGNPIFMLAARFFITLFGGGMSTAAIAVNTMSALLSAATILLLFWSVTHLIRRIIVSDDTIEIGWWKMTLIMAGGICAALAYAWSDTFWFSAVEGEVYAFSSFCTALVFWLMLKWENRADLPHSDRYLILIAYVIGVSIAVHLLNLLCIPALGLIFYYRKWRNTNATGSLIALAISCVIVAAILYGLVPGFIQVAQWFELLFVNFFGMSYNMGVLIYAVLLVAVIICTIKSLYAAKSPNTVRLLFLLSIALSGMPFIGHSASIGALIIAALAVYLWGFCRKIPVRIFTLIAISILVIFVGYSSYALLLIRASANTPMNQNAPDNVFSLASYLNREQYGDRPLFNGPAFAEALVEEEYPQGSGKYYVIVNELGLPETHVIDNYLRDENGSVFNNPTRSYTKVVKTDSTQADKYVEAIERPDYRTVPDLNMLFTRIYSNDPDGIHVSGYKSWAGYSTPDLYNIPADVRRKWAEQGYAPKYEVLQYLPSLQAVNTNVYRENTDVPVGSTLVWKPGFGVNLSYFINYQLNHMYWRYFMWNFAGRQNDIQGNGEPHLGNWISGIPAIDNARLGDQSLLPDEFGKGNKGHNVFYMLPLILGLIGLLWQALYNHRNNPMRGIQHFWVVFFLFFMTGIAIVLYLNQTPGQPRERDYAFAGSFYAFAIWIGMGIPAIGIMLRDMFTRKPKKEDEIAKTSKGTLYATAGIACVLALAIPLQMVSQTWDDHDRSGRYTTRDFGFNYLASLDENAIIFTNGDNDTFPLWYAQEVEGFRTDVRVVNLSYLTTDWYANQMQLPTSGANRIPMLAKPKDYAYERLAYSFVLPSAGDTTALAALGNLYSSDARTYGAPILSMPKMHMPVDTSFAMQRYGTGNILTDDLLMQSLGDIKLDFSRNGGLNQSKVLSLDMVANSVANNWERPTYFATTVPTSYYLGLSPYLGAMGMAYEVTPFHTPLYSPTATKAYDRILNDFRWGGLDEPGIDIYLDETVRRMAASLRSGVYTTIEELMQNGMLPASQAAKNAAAKAGLEEPATQYDMARQLLNKLTTKLPTTVLPYESILGLYFARTYLDLYLAEGNAEDLAKATAIANEETDRFAQLVRYGANISPVQFNQLGSSEIYAMQYLGEAIALRNYADILAAMPDMTDEQKAIISSSSFEQDLQMVELLYINSYTADEIEEYLNELGAGQRAVAQKAIDVLRLNEAAGIDPMTFSREIMNKYTFSPEQWSYVLR